VDGVAEDIVLRVSHAHRYHRLQHVDGHGQRDGW
jgi:hypothetical protein